MHIHTNTHTYTYASTYACARTCVNIAPRVCLGIYVYVFSFRLSGLAVHLSPFDFRFSLSRATKLNGTAGSTEGGEHEGSQAGNFEGAKA